VRELEPVLSVVNTAASNTFGHSLISHSRIQPLKVVGSIEVMEAPMVTLINISLFLKALVPTLVTVSGNTTISRFLHPLKALSPIVKRPVGSVSVYNAVQS
jgi:hypothetical protein